MPFGLQGRSALQDQMNQWAQQPLVAQPPAMDVPAPQITPPKPGFFGQGGVGRNIVGSIGDALMAIGHLQPTYGPAMQAQRQHAQDLADEQRKASTQWDTWQRQQEYKAAHPDPVNNDTVNDVRWYMGASDAEKEAYRSLHPLYKQGPDGQFYAIQTSPPPPDTLPANFEFGGPQVPPAGNFRHP